MGKFHVDSFISPAYLLLFLAGFAFLEYLPHSLQVSFLETYAEFVGKVFNLYFGR